MWDELHGDDDDEDEHDALDDRWYALSAELEQRLLAYADDRLASPDIANPS
jgi:hypothetical protein